MLKTIPALIQSIRPGLQCVTAREAFDECSRKNGIIIDVREPEEIKTSTIANAINIPRGLLEMKMSTLYPQADTPVYICCATGARATLSAEQLERIGYTCVTVITCTLEKILSECE